MRPAGQTGHDSLGQNRHIDTQFDDSEKGAELGLMGRFLSMGTRMMKKELPQIQIHWSISEPF